MLVRNQQHRTARSGDLAEPVTPDSVIKTIKAIHAVEGKAKK
jgi:hypothetical protein